jgi:hypothetical protein
MRHEAVVGDNCRHCALTATGAQGYRPLNNEKQTMPVCLRFARLTVIPRVAGNRNRQSALPGRSPEQSASEGHSEGHRGTLWDTVRGTPQSAQGGAVFLINCSVGNAT